MKVGKIAKIMCSAEGRKWSNDVLYEGKRWSNIVFFFEWREKALMSSEKTGNCVTMSYTKAVGGVSTSSEFTFIVKVKAGAGVIMSLAKRWIVGLCEGTSSMPMSLVLGRKGRKVFCKDVRRSLMSSL